MSAETWIKLIPVDEEHVREVTVSVEYERMQEDDRPPDDYVTMSRRQVERFLIEAGYRREGE